MTTYVGNMRLERQNTSTSGTPATVRRRFMAPAVEHCGSDFCQDVVNICPAFRKRYVNFLKSTSLVLHCAWCDCGSSRDVKLPLRD